ncbi:MAG: hypothetical protein IKF14_13225 [Atopobiaceae bacterium]|nr:hypothetical protein [Atopobiaceae bacterium]
MATKDNVRDLARTAYEFARTAWHYMIVRGDYTIMPFYQKNLEELWTYSTALA